MAAAPQRLPNLHQAPGIVIRALILGLTLAVARPAVGQGPASAVVDGSVVTATGEPLPGAQVVLRNLSTGGQQHATTGSHGGFLFEPVAVGGPYRLEARAIGYQLRIETGLVLALGDRVTRRLVLTGTPSAELQDIVVRGHTSPGEGGPTWSIPEAGIRHLPLFNRDFTALFITSPQVASADFNSIGGQHPGLNAIQIDGGSGGDVYGLSGTPGANAGANSISIEALKEIRISSAPLDIRQGGFSGGLIEAVTRSGTNRFEGSAFSLVQSPHLVGPDPSGAKTESFNFLQYGLSLGGPVKRDRLHFFVVADLQSFNTPFVDPGIGPSQAAADRVAQIFRTQYGFDAGGTESPVLHQPDRNIFAKLTWQAARGHRVELTNNWSNAHADGFSRDPLWFLSKSGDASRARVNTTRLRVTSSIGRGINELLAGYQVTAEDFSSNLRVPLFEVGGQEPTHLAGGSNDDVGQGATLDQRLVELTDNFSWTRGRHQLLIGSHAELFHVVDNLMLWRWGHWTFGNADLLDQRQPNGYEVGLPLRPGGAMADVPVNLVAGYLQDRWTPTERVSVTAGLRFDVPFVSAPATNPMLAASAALGNIDTGRFPSGNLVLSPRLGLSYAWAGAHPTILRVGIGAFTGRPPVAWLGQAFLNTGLDQVLLTCGPADGVPPPTTDIGALPDRCLNQAPGTVPPANVVYFDPNFRFPQSIKTMLGLDHDFGRGVRASVDLLYTRTRNSIYQTDVNLVPAGLNAEGRMMYGQIDTDGNPIPTRADTAFAQVFRNSNRSGDRFGALTLSIGKQWPNGGYIQAGYQWSRSEDYYTVEAVAASRNFGHAPIDGTIADRHRTRSGFDVPHVVTLSGALPLPYGVFVSGLFRVESGRPYAYVVNGDANADGAGRTNDLIYLPKHASDITLDDPSQFAALDRFIATTSCLQRQRGRIMTRNSCRNPAVTTLDLRLAKEFRLGGSSRLEVGADFFGLLNLIDHDWGLIPNLSDRETVSLLEVVGWDQARNRPAYQVPSSLPRTAPLQPVPWRMQLSARYRF